MLQFNIITVLPKAFGYLNESILGKAQEKKLIKINIHNLRDFTFDKHKTVDDRPYGGGPGMILKIEPIYKTLQFLKAFKEKKKEKIILLTPKGKTFNQNMAKKLSQYKRITILCGRYEGFDARIEKLVDEKISVGDYVLNGGEAPAMIIVDAVSRLIPGVIGKKESLKEETFSKKKYFEYPQYTRPEIFKIKRKYFKVPKVLLSGNHGKIEKWKRKKEKIN